MTNNIDKYRKQSDFTAPEGYYEELYEKMMNKIAKKGKTILFTRRSLLYSLVGGAIAAAVALLIVFNLSIFTTHNPQTQTQTTPLLLVEETGETPEVNTTTIVERQESAQVLLADNKSSSSKAEDRSTQSDKTLLISDNEEEPVRLDDLSYSVIEFYNDAALDNLFQETMMDLECYVDF